MFDFVPRKRLDDVLEEVERSFQTRLRELEDKFEDRFDRIKTPAEPAELARAAIREILTQINPAEFLNNLLAHRGITIEGLVKNVVEEKLSEFGIKSPLINSDDILSVVGEIADRAWAELDMDSITTEVAEKLTGFLVKQEGKESLLRVLAEASVDSVIDIIDLDELYPHLGEKVLEHLRTK